MTARDAAYAGFNEVGHGTNIGLFMGIVSSGLPASCPARRAGPYRPPVTSTIDPVV